MSIRRKSTAHDLATLRLHPDGSRVQQSSVNAKRRTAGTTVVDPRGNWIAKDAGGKSSVKTRRNVVSVRRDDTERELIDLSGDEDAHDQGKGKQRARDSHTPDEVAPPEPASERLNTRARQRHSFVNDLSFLDPSPVAVSSLKQDTITSTQEPVIAFPDPAPDLLKSIHHFASCYYRERGELFDGSREKKAQKSQSQENVHVLAANTLEHHDTNSETEHTEAEDQSLEEDEDESNIVNAEDGTREEGRNKARAHRKNMYKAFDGSALMAMGIVLQEYVAHTLVSRSRASGEARSPKRRRTVQVNRESSDRGDLEQE